MTVTVEASVARPVGFTAPRREWVDALGTVAVAVSTSPYVPCSGGVLLTGAAGDLEVTATDGSSVVSVRVPGAAPRGGRVVVDHRELVRLLAALVKGTAKRTADATPVTLACAADGAVSVECAGYTVPVTSWQAEKFPAVPEPVPVVAYVDGDRFAGELARVLSAVNLVDTTMPWWHSVSLAVTPCAVRLFGTDRYRLAVAHLPAVVTGEAPGAMVDGALLAKVGPKLTSSRVGVGVSEDTDTVTLAAGPVTLTTRSTGEIPESLLEFVPTTTPASVTVDRAALAAQTGRAAAILAAKQERDQRVNLTLSARSVTLAPVLGGEHAPVTAPHVPADVRGTPPAVFCFNPAYLLDALRTCTADTVTLHLPDDPGRAVLFTDTPEGIATPYAFRHLVNPIRPKST